MIYSIDKIHEIKNPSERGNGKTVDVLMNAIGMIMVTENETIPLIVPVLHWEYHLKKEFCRIVYAHFNEEPIIKKFGEFSIKGYSSKIRIFSEKEVEMGKTRGLRMEPLYDN